MAQPRIVLLAVAIALTASGVAGSAGATNGYLTYTLDLSEVTYTAAGAERTGMLTIAHNQVVAFPLDLSATHGKVRRVGSNTVLVAQTKSSCAIDGIRRWLIDHEGFISNLAAFGPVQPKDAADIRSLTLAMPYRNQTDPYVRVPKTFCLGFHTRRYGWILILTPIKPSLDDSQQEGLGRVEIDAYDVDIVGILFDSNTVIRSISFEARKRK